MSQELAVHAWWNGLDELTRRRLLHLRPDESLPDDIALDLQMAGVLVAPLGTYAQGDGEVVTVWAQPDALYDLLQAHRGGRSGWTTP